eukprot:TRINITY_DN81486_c0_g1_i1.p1 TRINITY_DN81486_c0_g1~~TRINITY_DN81486_c0_g1_i1.p1  ORF type:complete len:511 (-),score=96.41 TRINITY_DN81486_c0_g1_i1:52-1398(-)
MAGQAFAGSAASFGYAADPMHPAAWTVVRIPIPAIRQGRFIGNGGENIKAFRKESGAEIHVRTENTESGGAEAEVSGHPVAVQRGEQLIRDWLGGANSTKMIDIPKEYVGAMIGAGGRNLREMGAKTDCKIFIKKATEFDVAADPGKSVCVIVGPSHRIPHAEELVWAKVAEVQQVQTRSRDPANQMQLRHVEVPWELIDDVRGAEDCNLHTISRTTLCSLSFQQQVCVIKGPGDKIGHAEELVWQKVTEATMRALGKWSAEQWSAEQWPAEQKAPEQQAPAAAEVQSSGRVVPPRRAPQATSGNEATMLAALRGGSPASAVAPPSSTPSLSSFSEGAPPLGGQTGMLGLAPAQAGVPGSAVQKAATVCPQWLRSGRCSYGKSCTFLHGDGGASPAENVVGQGAAPPQPRVILPTRQGAPPQPKPPDESDNELPDWMTQLATSQLMNH